MTFTQDFLFSQKSLQDFIDCPRRFELKYILNIDWPAEESKPFHEFEEFINKGNDFHRFTDRYFQGISEEVISEIVQSDLESWWQNFLDFIHERKFLELESETLFKISLKHFHLIAKFDLLALSEENILHIYDWKTTAGKMKPSRKIIEKKLQTRIYPFILANSKLPFSSLPEINPSLIRLSYWYPQFPSEIVTFEYSDIQYELDKAFLLGLLEEIDGKKIGDFLLTDDLSKCKYCIYRSFCERGIQAGYIIEANEEIDISLEDLDFDIIEEIEY